MSKPSKISVKLRLGITGSQVKVIDEHSNIIIIDLDLRISLIKLSSAMNLRQRNGRWYLRLWLNGSRREFATGERDYDKALLKISEIVRKATQETSRGPITFAEYTEEYIPYAKANKAEKTATEEIIKLKRILEALGKRKLSEITTREIESYLLRRGKNVGNATVARDLALIRFMFRKAVEWGYIKENPAQKIKAPKEPPGRSRWLKDSERERLLYFCKHSKNPLLYEIVLTGLNTGMRKGELQQLTWDDVDFSERVITLRKTKNNEIRHIPISKSLLPVLTELRYKNPHWHYVFSKPDGTAYGRWDHAFKSACKKSGIKDFRFHDLRHTFGSYLGMQGENAYVIKQLMGHKTLAMTDRYTHIDQPTLRAAVDAVGGKVGKTANTELETIS